MGIVHRHVVKLVVDDLDCPCAVPVVLFLCAQSSFNRWVDDLAAILCNLRGLYDGAGRYLLDFRLRHLRQLLLGHLLLLVEVVELVVLAQGFVVLGVVHTLGKDTARHRVRLQRAASWQGLLVGGDGLLLALGPADDIRRLRSLAVEVREVLEVVLLLGLTPDVGRQVGSSLVPVLAVVPLVLLLLTVEALGLPPPLLLRHGGGTVDP